MKSSCSYVFIVIYKFSSTKNLRIDLVPQFMCSPTWHPNIALLSTEIWWLYRSRLRWGWDWSGCLPCLLSQPLHLQSDVHIFSFLKHQHRIVVVYFDKIGTQFVVSFKTNEFAFFPHVQNFLGVAICRCSRLFRDDIIENCIIMSTACVGKGKIFGSPHYFDLSWWYMNNWIRFLGGKYNKLHAKYISLCNQNRISKIRSKKS